MFVVFNVFVMLHPQFRQSEKERERAKWKEQNKCIYKTVYHTLTTQQAWTWMLKKIRKGAQ